MPLFTHKINQTYITDEGNVVAVTDSQTGSTELGWNDTIAATSDNIAVAIAFTVANVKSLLLYSSTALTIKTNSSSSPTQTIILTAGEAIMWATDFAAANPITANVTELFLSNDTSGIATVQLRFLIA